MIDGVAGVDVVFETWLGVLVLLYVVYFSMEGAGAEVAVLAKRMAAAINAVGVYILAVNGLM